MLSVCIPVFNYDVTSLVKEVREQCVDNQLIYEIVVLDDCSFNHQITAKNRTFLSQLNDVKLIENSTNIGNKAVRQKLVSHAQYDWILFLDADTFPFPQKFIFNYLKCMKSDVDAVCGGIVYDDLTNHEHILRWTYGKKFETFHTPDKVRISEWKGANFMIKKSVFESYTSIDLPQKYGFEDALFGIQLKEKGYILRFIDNPVIHKGLEDADTFLEKTHQALKNAYFLMRNRPEFAQEIRLVKLYKKLKKLGLGTLLSSVFPIFKSVLYKNLTSRQPSMKAFQLYKLLYFSRLASSKIDKSSAS